MAKKKSDAPKATAGSPAEILATYFRKSYPSIYRKVQLQVRRTPRRQTGEYKTNRESRWKLNQKHPRLHGERPDPSDRGEAFRCGTRV